MKLKTPQLKLVDETVILTSGFDTKLINDNEGIIYGEEIEITYLASKTYQKTY